MYNKNRQARFLQGPWENIRGSCRSARAIQVKLFSIFVTLGVGVLINCNMTGHE